MKNVFLYFSIFYFILNYSVHAQCGLKEKIVPGTNKKILSTKSLITHGTPDGGGNDELIFHISKVDSLFVLSGTFNRAGIIPKMIINEECPLVYYINENNRIILPPLTILEVKKMIWGAGEYSIELSYLLTPNQIIQLATTTCKEMRIYFKSEEPLKRTFKDSMGNYFKIFYYPKGQMKIFEQMRCFLSQN